MYFLKSKIAALFCSLFALFASLQISSLEAGGWGKTDTVTTYEETLWNGVFFDMNGLNFTASLPNYSGTVMQGNVSLYGTIEDVANYVICTTLESQIPPKSQKEFLKMIQDANPTYQTTAVDGKPFGAKYVVDLIPSKVGAAYWRFVCTKDRLIQMGTDDANGNRRIHFFNSILIQ